MAEKVTNMVLEVDLQCSYCYKEVKKILCKFHHIRDQNYNKKANTVTITVVCCDPEKIRDKLCSKGSKVIKTIKIQEPPKPRPREPERERECKPVAKPVLVPSGYPSRICYCPGPCYHVYGCQVPWPYCWCGCSGYRQYCYYFNEESPSYCSIV